MTTEIGNRSEIFQTRMQPANPTLAAMQERFIESTRKKSENVDDALVNQEGKGSIKEDIVKLERTLAAEIKRRIESTKALQELFADQVVSAKSKLDTLFSTKVGEVERATESISSRLNAIESEFANERERYIADLSERTALVARDLVTLQSTINHEKSNRSEKESGIVKKLAEIDLKLETRLQSDKTGVEQKFSSLRDALAEYKRVRDKGDEKFQAFVLEEIASLKNSMVIETQSREQSDEDIIQALNHYTKALQDALRIVNSA